MYADADTDRQPPPRAASDSSVVTEGRPTLSRPSAWVPGAAPEGRTHPSAQRRPGVIQPREGPRPHPRPPITEDPSACLPSSLPVPQAAPRLSFLPQDSRASSSEQQATCPGAERFPARSVPSEAPQHPWQQQPLAGTKFSKAAAPWRSLGPRALVLGWGLLFFQVSQQHPAPHQLHQSPPRSVGCSSSQGLGKARSRSGDSRDSSGGLWASVGSSHS